MTAQQEIIDWLNSGKDFDAGYKLFEKYSRNRALMHYLTRKRNLEKLTYELQKMVSLHLKTAPATEATPGVRPISPIAREITQETFKQVQLNKVDPATLAPEQRKVYDEITEAYKLQRVFHEKMKLATTDGQRAEFREVLVNLDTIIDKGWKGIDAFVKSGEEVPAKAEAKNVLEISKEINACRSYISRNLAALPSLGDKKEKRLAEIKKRVELLILHEAPVSNETFWALLESDIIDRNTTLKVELQK